MEKKKEEMTTLVSCSNKLLNEGYKENFVAKENGLEAPSTKKVYPAEELRIVNFYRFEGNSDPADNSILYAIESNDGVKGMVIDAYGGGNADPNIAKLISRIEEISKKEHHSKK
jgi:hypothetical protein